MELVEWKEFENKLDIVKDFEEFKKIEDKYDILLTALKKQFKGNLRVTNKGLKYRIKLYFKLGELWNSLDDERGIRTDLVTSGNEVTAKQQVLKELKRSRKEISKCKKLLKIDNKEEELEKYEAYCNDNREEVSRAGFERFSKGDSKIEKKESAQFSLYGENIYFESGIYSEDRFDDYIIDDDKYPTITTLSRFFHKDTMKEFSLREYARVQTFPDSFKFVGNYSTIKKQIGNAVAPDMARYISKNLKGNTFGDLFAGCGGMSLGLHNNGKNCKWAVEWNSDALKTYRINFKKVIIYNKDIRKIVKIEPVDIIVGGPPCQGFSLAGNRFKDDPRNKLYKEFLRVIKMVRPKEFIMENVPQIEKISEAIIYDFEELNYKVRTELVKGSNLGMRQDRKRYFFIGELNE